MIRVISLRPIWAWCAINAGKDVENRTWRTNYRGPLAIHASGNTRGIADDCDAADAIIRPARVPDLVPLSAIVGVVDLVDVVRDSRSRWAARGCWHWVLRNPRPCEHVDIGGRLGLWTYEGELKWTR